MSGKYKINEVGKLLFEFEKTEIEKLNDFELNKFALWQAVKTPLYFHLIRLPDTETTDNVEQTLSGGASLSRKIWQLSITAFSDLVKVFSFLPKFFNYKIKNIKPVLFLVNSADKLAKDAEGNYFNFLVDAFITKKIVNNYVYAEFSHKGDYRRPSPAKTDIPLGFLHLLVHVLKRFFLQKNSVRRAASAFTNLLNEFFASKNLQIPVSEHSVENTIANFYAEEIIYSIFYRLIKPKAIITSEKIGTGILAAANKQKINVLELQHGLIDEYHPYYQYAAEAKPNKKEMILPEKIGVFGQIHKEWLLQKGFWDELEIVVLGSSRMEGRREAENFRQKIDETNFVLLPTQWTVFREIIFLIEELSKFMDKENYRIILKPHPLESADNIAAYKILEKKFPDYVSVTDAGADIYDLINSSKIVLGFDSTTLLEAVALSVPSITVGTSAMPNGIHDLITTKSLMSAIKPVNIKEFEKIHKLVCMAISDNNYYKNWKNETSNCSSLLYVRTYYENLNIFFTNFSV